MHDHPTQPGLCQCGCGQATKIAKRKQRTVLKGQPMRFVNHHATSRPGTTLAERFWEKVACGTPDVCWLWTAHLNNNGYGTIGARGRHIYAHRVSWEMHHDAIPDGMHVLHRCDVPACVNPAHLFLGTHAENMADMAAKGRAGGLAGEAHPRAKLTEADVREIRALATDGVSRREIGARYGVAHTSVNAIVARKNWPHVI